MVRLLRLVYWESMIAIWRFVAAFAGTAFLLLTGVQLYASAYAHSVDAYLARLIAPVQNAASIQGFLGVTEFGGTLGTVLITIGALYFLRRNPHVAIRLVIVVAGSAAVANLVKQIVSRVRPDPLIWFDPLLTYSFPSGHATSAMALYGFLMVASALLLPSGIKRTTLMFLCSALVLMIGASRLVLGAHFLSDVVGGYLLGLFWIGLVLSFRKKRV